MKKFIWLCLLLLSLCQMAAAADFSHLVIIHTNDRHGYDQKGDGVYGMAAVAALKKDYEQKGYEVLLVDGGDAIQDHNLVNISQGATAIAFMNAAGYDAMALGNHEFDYGQDVVLKRADEAKFPFVSCNVLVQATGTPFVQPHAVMYKGGLKIGIVGMTTPETAVAANPKYVRGLTFLDGGALFAKVQEEVDSLRRDGCDLIVALGHLGSLNSSAGHRSDDVLRHVDGIDIFIDGHDHQTKARREGQALLAEAGFHLNHIGVIVHDGEAWQEHLLPYGAYDKEDEEVKAIVDAAAADVEAALSKPIGTSSVLLQGNRSPGVRTEETNLGDFVADAILWQARQASVLDGISVDGAIVNGGGLRDSIRPGVVTQGQIRRVLPYGNELYIMKIKGRTLLEIMEAATAAAPEEAGAFPQVAGIEMTVRTDIPFAKGKPYGASKYYGAACPGQRVTIQRVGGRPFSPDEEYAIATYEFICRGGDAYGALTEPGKAELCPVGYVDRDAVAHYLADELEGRIGEDYGAAQGRIRLVDGAEDRT